MKNTDQNNIKTMPTKQKQGGRTGRKQTVH